MRPAESKSGKIGEAIVTYGIGIPVVGLLMGGIYSMPAMRLCRGRDPWLTVLLGMALAVTVFGLGYLAGTPVLFSTGGWALSIVLLLAARRLHGTLDGNLERFGLVHAAALLIAFALAALN